MSVICSMLAAVEEHLANFRSDEGYGNGGLNATRASNGPKMPPNNQATLDTVCTVAVSSLTRQNQAQAYAERYFGNNCWHVKN